MRRHAGQCHCGDVTFEFDAPVQMDVTLCDCSICSMTGYQHVFIPQGDLRFTAGQDKLTEYNFNTGAARHFFCSRCGIKPLYIPRSHPECYSVNLRCITAGTLEIGHTIEFSGTNWENNIDALKDQT